MSFPKPINPSRSNLENKGMRKNFHFFSWLTFNWKESSEPSLIRLWCPSAGERQTTRKSLDRLRLNASILSHSAFLRLKEGLGLRWWDVINKRAPLSDRDIRARWPRTLLSSQRPSLACLLIFVFGTQFGMPKIIIIPKAWLTTSGA